MLTDEAMKRELSLAIDDVGTDGLLDLVAGVLREHAKASRGEISNSYFRRLADAVEALKESVQP